MSEMIESPVHEQSPLQLSVEYSDRVNFAMQQNGVPLVTEIQITNPTQTTLEQVTVTVTLENDECEPWTTRIAAIGPDSTYRVQPEDLALSAKQLATRTEAERTAICISVHASGQSVNKSYPVELLAFDQWPGIGHYPELTAAFVTPNHPRVVTFLKDARTSLGSRSDSDAIDGYQSGSRQRAALIAEACFHAVATHNIGYINPPASFATDGQRVRLIDRICRENFGTCLDLSLLLASLWEQCGLHPLILMPEGHAMPALWTHEAHCPEAAIEEPAQIRNLIELGHIVPVESTLLTQPNPSFNAAVESAKRRMSQPGGTFCAIDIKAGRKRGVLPLPLRDGDTTVVDLELITSTGKPTTAQSTLDRLELAERAEQMSRSPLLTDTDESPSDRIARWQKRLLDLSLRN
ncbi:MAG: hypothetical protein KC983_06900, partial [Phycisphaerales bacterium]|nr:hypothetical protein [Phycisphaerales bacterium]